MFERDGRNGSPSPEGCEPGEAGEIQHLKTILMTDLIYVAVVAVFFVAGKLYAQWCEKL
jgi:hypothetical protein